MTLATQPAAIAASLPTTLSWRDILKRWSLRWGIARNGSAVPAGLYRIGSPTSASPVLVTCNYRMTVDLVRGDLKGVDAWLLVLETYGVNVWCAAGKGTFSTDELVRRIYSVHLAEVVDHERIILPQLGASGVAAQTVRELTGYRVVWGPIRSADLRAFLADDQKATPEMRAVTFTFAERMVLAPVEFLGAFRWIWAVAVLVVLAVIGGSIGARAFVPEVALMALVPERARLPARRCGGRRGSAGRPSVAPVPGLLGEERDRRGAGLDRGTRGAPRDARNAEPVDVDGRHPGRVRLRELRGRELHRKHALHVTEWRRA